MERHEGLMVDSQLSAHPVAADLIIKRLSSFVILSKREEAAISSVPCASKRLAPGETLMRQGTDPSSMFLILSGIAYRYRYLANGKRQIFGYLLPGDLCDIEFMISNDIDHDIVSLTDTEVAIVPTNEIMACGRAFANIRRALLKSVMADGALMREWLLNVGQRSAPQRLAYFICELSARLDALAEKDSDGTYFVPLTQSEIADTTGMTVAHVSRCMQQFRRSDLVSWSKRQLHVRDADGLRRVAGWQSTQKAVDVPPLEYILA